MNNAPEQLLKKLTLLAESLNASEGTASNHLISHEFKSSDLSSYTHLLQNLARTDLAAVQKSL